MHDFGLYIITAVALVFIIEGLIYALFPDAVRRLMALAVMMPVPRLRLFGLIMVTVGFVALWGLRMVTGS